VAFCYEYPRPALTADCIIFSKDEQGWCVLLIERKHEPFKGMWAFPGGFINMDETIEEGAARELMEETGLSGIVLEQFHAFSRLDRDPRGRTVTVAFLGFAEMQTVYPMAGDDAARVQWFSVAEIPTLAFDHDEMLQRAISIMKQQGMSM
jgi:8-oxo-dGTP diphosphatase